MYWTILWKFNLKKKMHVHIKEYLSWVLNYSDFCYSVCKSDTRPEVEGANSWWKKLVKPGCGD